ncbi:MAG: cell division protein SepF [Firmicutes bacterium]|nr:cell division protein SepF [Bacillota bacterium]
MGLFDFVSKGFTSERKPSGKVEEQPAMTHIPQTEPVNEPEPQAEPVTPKEVASAVLFDVSKPAAATVSYQSQPANNGFSGAFSGNTLGNRHILVISPRTDAEVINIVEHLRTNEAVIINFEGIPVAETQRRIDFLSGVSCGLGGTISPLDTNKFIMTPSGIGIKK